MDRLLGRYSDYIFAMARIVVAFLFMQHGLMKLFGMFGGIGESGGHGCPLFKPGGGRRDRNIRRPLD